jgi:hypothetical protein
MEEDFQKENNNNMENWKQFHGTELGSLLGSIYGSQSNVKINYPKPKQQRTPSEKKLFIPGGASSESSDPRKVTRRAANVVVPKPTGRTARDDEFSSLKPVDLIPKRRSAEHIKSEMEDIKLKQERYRPAHVKPISSESEKEKLSQIFTFKGGKALPEEMTHPVGETPLELQQRRKEKERIDAIREKRGLSVIGKQNSAPAILSVNEQLAQQVSREIEERTTYLHEMKGLGGLSAAKERQVRQEIQSKVYELQKLNEKL